MTTATDELAHRATIRDLVGVFALAERDIRAAFASIDAAERRLNAAFMLGETLHRAFTVSACGTRYHDNFQDADEAIRILTRSAWRCIVERFELRRFMAIKRWSALIKAIDGDALPPITEEAVQRFLFDQLAHAREHLTEAVNEVFEWLRPRQGSHVHALKTNSELEVPERVILAYVVQGRWSGAGFEIDYQRRQHLVALENVFRALDGRGAIPGYEPELETAIKASADGEGETDLFRFRCCQNRNLHLTFKRTDLLARFNQIAGGKRLRPAETETERLRKEVEKARAENERLRRSVKK